MNRHTLCFYLCLTVAMLVITTSSIYMKSSVHSKAPSQSYYGDHNKSEASGAELDMEILRHRKLLFHGSCTNRDISISQSRDFTSGIPQYIVQIVNTCISGCAPSNIHLHCGWFASARMVSPKAFKRLSYDDCLVNGGRALKTSQIIRFTYSNSFMYPLVLKSARFC